MSAENKPAYSPGLEGVIAGESAICWVDPNAGLLYRGYDIHELAPQVSFEEIAWLLLRGELPTMAEAGRFSRELAESRDLPAPVIELLRLFPKGTHPMDMIRTGASMLAAFDRDLNDHSPEANLRKATRLIARMSTLTTTAWRLSHDQELIQDQITLTHAGNFLLQLRGEVPEMWRTHALDCILALYADHEFNASTFSARVTASTLADMYAAVTTALGTLKGPLHGGANEDSMRMLREVGSPDRAEAWVKERLARHEKITGFGHRVYKKGDSRVPIMREIARQLGARFGQEHWVPVCEALEAVMEREKHLCANVDLYAAPVFHMLGIAPELNTPIFAVSRISGWCAHVIEQQAHNRLIRPRCIYTGPPPRKYQPVGAKKTAG
ncbi:MAG TPA: citrate/2-methylcitrate synthase [Verrucomicrobiae bacterium]|jgi:2-methylcitrate synthase/citrate synthase II